MIGRNFEQLLVGRKALIKLGSPVRQWLCTLEDRPRKWLTPVRYPITSERRARPNTGRRYFEVTIARVMPPYAIVYHHDGRGWIRLWLDMREVDLRLTGE
jgi:hypothetical protein